jgi:tRNA wybutosine-synthesizing protein 3
MVSLLNQSLDFYTTSSCSGRIIVISHPDPEDGQEEQGQEQGEGDVEGVDVDGRQDKLKGNKPRKKGCRWLFVSHSHAEALEVRNSLEGAEDSALLKFEPFILHVCCKDLSAGKRLLDAALGAGLKNSGLTISKRGRVILAARCTPSYQIPLSCDGKLLVSEEYVEFVVEKANQALVENNLRIDRFYSSLQRMVTTEGVNERK